MDELNIKWMQVLELIKTKLSEVSFITWFEPLEPVEIKGNEIIIKTTMVLAKNAIENNYIPLLSDALYKVYNFPVTPIIMLSDEVEKYEFNKPKVSVPEDETDFGLNPAYTFDNFVVGGSNRMAHAAALAVAEMPGSAYNPLYIYGHSGLGKTHLMHAIGNYALGRNPSLKILYVSSETFTIEFIDMLAKNQMPKFRGKYRSVDMLLVDDIQFIAGKVQTEEEFFHTFNTLFELGKQIIVSGDRPPNEMTALEERIRSRLGGNLMCDIQPPDYETRLAILKNKCRDGGFELSLQTLDYIASNVVNNVRELNGALTRVKAFSAFDGQDEPSPKKLEEILKDIITPVIKNFTIEEIIQKVSDFYDVSREDIISTKQHKEIVLARQVAMFISRQLTSKPLKEIGKAFNRNYSTVIDSIAKIESMLHTNAQLKQSVDNLIHSLREY